MDDKLQIHDLNLNDVGSSGQECFDEMSEDLFVHSAELVVDPDQRFRDLITICLW